MKISRDWAPDYEVSDGWSSPLEIARTRCQLIFKSETVSLDNLGFRKHTEMKQPGTSDIIALGGSTTFGYFVNNDSSWPAQLERLSGLGVVNLSQVKGDVWTSITCLLDKVRHSPDTTARAVLTYDGVNQSSAFLAKNLPHKESLFQHPNYNQLQQILTRYRSLTSSRFSFEHLAFFLFGSRFLEWQLARRYDHAMNAIFSDRDITQAAEEEARNYLACLKILREVSGSCLNAEVIAFLQPFLFQYWKGGGEEFRKRSLYLNSLYERILECDSEVIDLRAVYGLNSIHFLDWAHVDSEGNRLIAEAIKNELISKNIF
jgi:hypothetical protein